MYLLQKSKKSWARGQLFLTWILLHSLGRVVIEVFRDDPRGPLLLRLSISMWISFLLIVISGIFLSRPQKPIEKKSND